MYGLKQAAVLAHGALSKILKEEGYEKIEGSLGMWKHTTRKTAFCLCIDDFKVIYYSKTDIDHLLTTLQKVYDVTVDWSGKHFLGYMLDWIYEKGFVDLSMPGYIKELLLKLQYQVKKHPQYSPHDATTINWIAKSNRQYAMQDDNTCGRARARLHTYGACPMEVSERTDAFKSFKFNMPL